MNKDIKKTNLKKLQLPKTGKTACISKTQPSLTLTANQIQEEDRIPSSSEKCIHLLEKQVFSKTNINVGGGPEIQNEKPGSSSEKSKLPKRTKLVSFINEDKNKIRRWSDDFETPRKNLKSRPVARIKTKSKPKRQAKLKTSFFKNEQLFSEIAAQHCRAENFNPDEIQLALAMSKSVTETSRISTEEPVGNSVKKQLQVYGFRTSNNEACHNVLTTSLSLGKGKRPKWTNKFTALTLRNPAFQLTKLNEKIDKFLGQQFLIEPQDPVAPLHDRYDICSAILRKCQPIDSFIRDSENFSTADQLGKFFVEELFTVSRVAPGHLLRNWSKIQGRDFSPDRCSKKVHTAAKYNKVYSVLEKFFCEEEIVAIDPANQKVISENCDERTNVADKEERTVKVIPAADQMKSLGVNDHEMCCTDALNADCNSPANKKLKMNEEASVTGEHSSSSLKSPAAGKKDSTLSQNFFIRMSSPDIFGDWESDTENNQDFSSESHLHGIRTFETFSSDEVKIFSNDGDGESSKTTEKVEHEEVSKYHKFSTLIAEIDLTQDDEQEKEIREKCFDYGITDEGISNHDKCSMQDSRYTNDLLFSIGEGKISSSPNLLFSSQKEISSSLTQNDNESDDDCIILSDDEINYSILKANKSMHGKGEIENENIEIENQFPDDRNNDHEFSFIDLIDADNANKLSTKYSSIDLDDAFTKMENDFFSSQLAIYDSPLKTSPSHKVKNLNSSFNEIPNSCSEHQSEEHTFKTPTKVLRKQSVNSIDKCRKALSESFLQSPSEITELSAPVKRFSSSCFKRSTSRSKLSSWMDNDDDIGSYSDLDEIDKLVHGSPQNKFYKKPAGLEKLLTGEISFRNEIHQEVDTVSISPAKSSPKSNDQHSQEAEEFEFNGRKYMVRKFDENDKPDYQSMDEATLLKHLYNFGIKRLRRELAIQILEYIYNQTHPYFIDDEDTKQSKLTKYFQPSHRNEESNTNEFKYNLQDCNGDILLRNCEDLSAEIKYEKYIFQTNISKKIHQALLPLHLAWFNLVHSNTALHETILRYEPIELHEIYVFFKTLGIRYDPKDMKSFFDSRSIIFRYDISATGKPLAKNRHVRRKVKSQTQITLTQQCSKNQLF